MFVRSALSADASVISHHKENSRDESRKYRGSLATTHVSGATMSWIAGVGDTALASAEVESIDTQTCRIVHLYVAPEAREIGIGDTLLQHLTSELRTKGFTWISAQALPGDRAMKNLFERHGLIAQSITVGKSLSDPSN